MNRSKHDVKVSIIVPVYNSEKFLGECINSVFKQSLKEIELIIVDDGSTDASCNIIEKYAELEKRIKFLKQNHQGAGPARNLGIKYAEGEYIAFLDSDDFYYNETALEQMYNLAKENSSLICASYKLYVYSNDVYSERNIFNVKEPFLKERLFNFDDIQNDFYYTQYLFSLQLIIKHKIKFPSYLRYQDPPFLMSVVKVCPKILVCPVELYCYRWGYKKVRFSERQVIDMLDGMYDVVKIAKEYGWNKLLQKIIDRINEGGGFYSDIKNNLSESVNGRLGKIEKMVCEAGVDRMVKLYDRVNRDVKVSIIVPVYNVEKFLGQCMNSLVSQTLRDIEIICVNDGSTDNSFHIMEDYAKKDRRVKIVDKPNAGYGHTMNTGLHVASGAYIGIVESDDWVELDMFEKLYNAAVANNYPDLIKSDAYISENAGKSEIIRPWGVNCDEIIDMEKHKKLIVATPSTCTAIYRRNLFLENDIKWNETPGASFQDTSFAIMMIMFSKRAYVISQPFYHYRVDRPESSRNTSNKGFCIFDEFNYIESVLGKRPEMKYKYGPIIQMTKYKRCQWCARLVIDTKAFWQKAAREFNIAQKDGLMIKELWEEADWQRVQKLIDGIPKEISVGEEIRKISDDDYIFPYHLVKPGSRVVIYGIGKAGRFMWSVISRDKVVTPVALLPRAGERCINNEYLEINDIKRILFDYVVISEPEKGEAKIAEKELLSCGIRPECIKWDGENYERSVFLRRYFYPLLKRVE